MDGWISIKLWLMVNMLHIWCLTVRCKQTQRVFLVLGFQWWTVVWRSFLSLLYPQSNANWPQVLMQKDRNDRERDGLCLCFSPSLPLLPPPPPVGMSNSQSWKKQKGKKDKNREERIKRHLREVWERNTSIFHCCMCQLWSVEVKVCAVHSSFLRGGKEKDKHRL